MGKKGRAYSDEFRAEVIEEILEGGADEREVARQRSVAVSTVRRWLRHAAEHADDTVPGRRLESLPRRLPKAEAEPEPEHRPSCRHRSYLEALRQLLGAVESDIDETKTIGQLEAAVDAVMAVTASRDASILARDESTGDMYFVACRGVLPPEDLLWKRVPPGHGIVQWVADQRRPVTINDVAHDPRFFAEIDSETGFRTRNLMAAPLERDGRVLGVIEVLNKADHALYTVEDLGNLRLMAAHLAALLARLA